MYKIIYLTLLLLPSVIFGQGIEKSLDSKDFGESDYLLNDLNIQIEVTGAVNSMYNSEFSKAEKEFRWLKYRFQEHPLPYFLLGLSEWWKMMPELDNVKSHDSRFYAYMDSSIYFAEKLFDKNENNIEAAFFLSAAHAFKGRLYSERGSWTKAAIAGKNSLKYLKISRENNELSPEFMFGDGVYNYYVEWIPENYPILKPVLAMFEPGDKTLGKEQLTLVSRNAFYTRTEAQYFLVRILAIEENDPYGGMELAKYLHKTFPNNAYFERFYARQLYVLGRFRDCEEVSLSILQKIDSGYAGYGATSGRYAGFFLGQIYETFRTYDKSLHYYQKAAGFAESIKATDTGYYLYSLLHAGKVAEKLEDKALAKETYTKLRKVSKRKHNANIEARKRLKEL